MKLISIFKQIYKFDKIGFFFVIFLNFIVMVFEIISIGSIIPLISGFMTNNDQIKIEKIINFNISFNQFLLIFLFIIIIKNLITAFQLYKINQIIYDYRTLLSSKIFNNILEQDYLYFKENKNSDLFQSVNDDPNIFSINVTKPALLVLSDLLMLFSIFIFLTYINFTITFIIFSILLFFLFLYFYLIKNYILFLGKQRRFTDERKVNFLSKALTSIKEIKIFNNKNFFIKYFHKYIKENSNILVISTWLQSSPRIILETFIIICLVIFVYFFKDLNDKTMFLSLAGFFSYAALKILPIANRIFINFQLLNYGMVYTQKVNQNLSLIKNHEIDIQSKDKIKIKNSIVLKNISLKIKNVNIIKNINFDVKANTFYGIKGISGSGKSTLIDIISGIIKPTGGSVFVDKKEINQIKYEWLNSIGYSGNFVHLMNDTIENNIIYGREKILQHDEKIEKLLNITGLKKITSNLESGLQYLIDDQSSNLSSGQKQRIGICRALYSNPNLIILDEATNALDKSAEIEILQNLKTNYINKTFIIISHNKDLIDICDDNFDFENIQNKIN